MYSAQVKATCGKMHPDYNILVAAGIGLIVHGWRTTGKEMSQEKKHY
jgi:hypothetical protein